MSTLFLLFLSLHVVLAALPKVDFNRMGKVALAGSFNGLDFFQNTSTTFDPSTSTLLSRSPDGSLSRLASTNSGGRILAGCALGEVFYFAGSFSSVGAAAATNAASYSPSSNTFAALGSNGPNGEVDAVFCDEKNAKVWFGGSFTSPAPSVAIWDPKAASWSSPPFSGLSGAQSRVLSITSNSSQSSLFFAGSFTTSFQGTGSTSLNGTNNPNVPYSSGASPFSSSLVPIPLQNAQIQGSPSSSNSEFSAISNILCPSGPDGPGYTWLAADGNTAVITIRTFSSISASGVRLGNTFLSGFGTRGFSVTTIPDNAVQPLSYVDPATGQNQSCTTSCPLSTDSSVLYQDFLFDGTLDITGVQIDLSEWTGSAPGLHMVQLLSSGAFASAIAGDNAQSCFAPNPSNTSTTGTWSEKIANTNISGTIQSVLTASVDVGTQAAQAPSFSWVPYVSAAGQYTINLLVPGCTNFQDCPLRTTVKVTVFPGQGLEPWVTTVSQQNPENAAILVYSGPILPSSPDFVTTITLTLADNPAGQGVNGKFELVADRVQMILTSAIPSSSGNGSASSNAGGPAQSGHNGFGFFEWPSSGTSAAAAADATKALPNSTETSLDSIGFGLYSSIGASGLTTSAINAVAHHSSGIIFLGGSFNLTSGTASGSANVVAFKNGALAALPGNGLNGPVTSIVVDGDSLFVGGSFNDTSSPTLQGKLRGITKYDVGQNAWAPLQLGVNGAVTSLSFSGGQVQLTGNFTSLLSSSDGNTGEDAAGFASWDVSSREWANSGGYLVGNMTFVCNGSIPSNGQKQSQYVAGNVITSLSFGATGLVMVQNGGSSGPEVTPLGVQLNNVAEVDSVTNVRRRRSHTRRGPTSWVPSISLYNLFARQASGQLVPLPAPQPALAPSVLAGAFWTNTSTSREVVIIGGNFSFTTSPGRPVSQGIAIYDPESTTISALQGPQINGTIRSLLVRENSLYAGGEFILQGTSVNGFAVYDLIKQQWDLSDIQTLQADSGTAVVVRSITKSTSRTNSIMVAGSFSHAGSLRCQSICSLDVKTKQWGQLGDGIQGEVASVDYAGNNQAILIASGSIALSDDTSANVARFSLDNNTWTAVGESSGLSGPVTAVTVNNGNSSSIFAAGRSNDGTSSFLSFWNGASWTNFGTALQGSTNVSQLAMVPLQDTHAANGIIEPDRMLLISGLLSDSFGNVSAALFDGQTIIPYIISTSSPGIPGSIYSLIHSFSSFSFVQRHFLATGVVILICIAIAAGVVFLLALTGILWTLFSGRDDRMNKMDMNDLDEDDNSSHQRPSSLLEHINVATRTTILGAQSSFINHSQQKSGEKATTRAVGTGDPDIFGPDASNYVRAETPSDAVGGILAAEEESSRPAHARYSFDGTGEGELPLSAGMEVEVLDDRDAAWWYARDARTGKEGVVPAAYLY